MSLGEHCIGPEHIRGQVPPHHLFDHGLLVVLLDQVRDPALPEQVRVDTFRDAGSLCRDPLQRFPRHCLGRCTRGRGLRLRRAHPYRSRVRVFSRRERGVGSLPLPPR